MARPAKLTRKALIESMTGQFLESGYEAASMGKLASGAGLGKATLYHHFPGGKEEIARTVLAHTGARLEKLILHPLRSVADTGAAALEANLARRKAGAALAGSLDGVLEFYRGPKPACVMNALMVGEGAHLFGADIADAFSVWRRLLVQALKVLGEEARSADDILELIQGSLVRTRADGTRAALEATVARLKGVHAV